MGVSIQFAPQGQNTTIGSAQIADDSIVNADINSAAAIAQSKLATLAITEALLSLSDNTTEDASTTRHGFLKKLDNTATNFMDGTGEWSVPAGSASGDIVLMHHARGSTASSTEVEVLTKTWDAADFGVLDTMWVILEGYNTNESGNAKPIIRIYDGTNTFSTAAPANHVYTLTEHKFIQGADATTQMISLGLHLGANDASPTGIISMDGETATLIANWLSAAFTLSIRGQTDGAGTAYYDLKVYKIKAA
jgi:hypothetical protein|tara:strand:- start:839 stop:1588 length:750 start_codon:yes stop_codon:yes gene_type:complete